MPILNIRQAKLGGSKAVIAIAGNTGEGKTYTALLMARGMVSKSTEIGFLDTENRRGSLYANILDGPFMIADLYPPFSPERYAESIKEFQASGVKVLVIDSVSHEWEGEGGCDDIANLPLSLGKKMADWKGAKRAHKKFVNTLLQADMHMIVCIRAREKTDFKNPNLPVSLGIQPVCEKNFMFEMTASLLITDRGKKQKFLKLPEFLKDSFGDGNDYIGKKHGKNLMDWLNKGEKEDPEVKKLQSELLMACESGLEFLKDVWKKLTKEQRTKMNPHWHTYEASAISYDKQLKDAENSDQDPKDKLREDQNNGGAKQGQMF